MKRILTKFSVVALSCFLLSLQASAEVSIGVVFSKGEIDVIASWYHDHRLPSSKGKGKNKAKGLPPGIAKNLARGKPLPPGIAKQVLPQGLIALLPPTPRGFERAIIDGRVVLVHIATHVIHDILKDIILH